MVSFRRFSPRSCRGPNGCHEPLVRSAFSPRNWLSDCALVFKQGPVQAIRLLPRSMLLCLADLLHRSSVSSALVQWHRLQPTCHDERSDRLFTAIFCCLLDFMFCL